MEIYIGGNVIFISKSANIKVKFCYCTEELRKNYKKRNVNFKLVKTRAAVFVEVLYT
jgi:hypothetical protein